MLPRNQVLLVKTETTYGVDAAPVASANSTLVFPVDYNPDVQALEYGVVRASISAEKKRLGRKIATFTIKAPLKGAGAAGTAPEIAPLIKACAMGETVNAGTDVQYKPVSASASMKSVTIYWYYDGRVVKAIGCMGNFSIDMPPGGYPTITFNMRGKLVSDSDASLPTSMSYQTTEPVIVESAGVSFGSFNDAVVKSMSFDSGNSVSDRTDVNSAEGVKGVSVTARNPKFSATVEATTEAVKAWWGNFTGRVEETVDITIGTVAGNIVTAAIPKFALENGMKPTEAEGFFVYPLSGQALESSGNDNITLTFK